MLRVIVVVACNLLITSIVFICKFGVVFIWFSMFMYVVIGVYQRYKQDVGKPL